MSASCFITYNFDVLSYWYLSIFLNIFKYFKPSKTDCIQLHLEDVSTDIPLDTAASGPFVPLFCCDFSETSTSGYDTSPSNASLRDRSFIPGPC